MGPPSHMIVWDLDRTLGVFDSLEGVHDPDVEAEVLLRPGIDRALTALAEAGFTHSVLTLATVDYAELALRGTGLRDHFVEVACPGQRLKGDAEGIAATFGIPFEELGDRMLFVGDHVLLDAPQDERVVFHLEPSALRRPAELVVELALALRERGEGSIRAGFDALLAAAVFEADLHRYELPKAGRLVLLPRVDICPVIAFDDDGELPELGTPSRFVPAKAYPDLAQRLRAAAAAWR